MGMVNNISNSNLTYLNAINGTGSKTAKKPSAYYSDYKDFPVSNRKSPPMSDEKFKEAIIAQAKKDAASGKIGGESAGCMSLLEKFRSVVSPDRHSIISNALKKVPQKLLAFGNLGFSEFFSPSGELVAEFVPGRGWASIATKAENQRTSEYYGVYMSAVREALSGKQSGGAAQASSTDGGTVDIMA